MGRSTSPSGARRQTRHHTRVGVGLLAAAAVLAACDDGAPDHGAPLMEPQASLDEPVVYRGASDTEEAWELTVTVRGLTCDIDLGEEVDAEPGHDRFCVVDLHLENTGNTANIEDFARNSTLFGDEQLGMASPVLTTEYIDEQGFAQPIGIEPGAAVDSAIVFDFIDEADPQYLELRAGTDDPAVIVALQR